MAWRPSRTGLLPLALLVGLILAGSATGHMDVVLVAGVLPVVTMTTVVGMLGMLAMLALLVTLFLGGLVRTEELPDETTGSVRYHPEFGMVDPRDVAAEAERQAQADRSWSGVVFLGPIPIPLGTGWRPWMLIVGAVVLVLMLLPWF